MSRLTSIKTQAAVGKTSRSDATSLRSDNLAALITFLLMGIFILLSALETIPPAAAPVSAPLTEFSSGRAMRRLAIIAQKPHPSGSAEHSAVRDYIVKEAAAMGFTPEIQKTTIGVDHYRARAIVGAIVDNILVTLPGARAGGKSVLLCAHYDTVPHSMGASDDGAGVVTLLEAMRSLRAGPLLTNDVLFLFTDGEEIGLLGAAAFVQKHPAAKNVKVVLNFDARGRAGPTIMYASTPNNGWLIGELAKAAPKPVANSLAEEIYQRMGHVTDFQVLATGDVQGLNFAYIGGSDSYHTQLDSLGAIDERSIQHNGSYALALARHFGNISLEPGTSHNTVFFSVLGSFLFHYSTSSAILVTIAGVGLFLAVAAVGLKRKRLTFAGMTIGFFAFVFSVICSVIIVSVIRNLTGLLPKDSLRTGNPDLYNSSLYFLGFIAVAIAVISALYIWFRKKTSIDNLSVGALFLWLILMISVSIAKPVGSYIFTWPLMFVLIAKGVDFAVSKKETDPMKLSLGLSLSILPAIALTAPLLYFCFLALGFLLLSPITTAIFLATAMLPLGLVISQLDFMLRPKKWLLPVTAAAAGLAFILVAKFTSHVDQFSRKQDSLFYALNANTGRAIWASLDDHPNEWTSQFLTSSNERRPIRDFVGLNLRAMSAEAPVLSTLAPNMKVLSDTTSNGIRSLNLRIVSNRQAPLIMVSLNPEAKVRAFVLDGRRYDEHPRDDYVLRYFAPPAEGIELMIELERSQSLVVNVTDHSYGLPEAPGVDYKPRPDYLMPSPHHFNHGLVITKSFAL
jgi:hypothetical protein